MTDTPPDWALIEAAKRCKWHPDHDETYLGATYRHNEAFRALCDMIAKHEQPPVDRKLLCAREAAARSCDKSHPHIAEDIRNGNRPGYTNSIVEALVAFELWESGYGA